MDTRKVSAKCSLAASDGVYREVYGNMRVKVDRFVDRGAWYLASGGSNWHWKPAPVQPDLGKFVYRCGFRVGIWRWRGSRQRLRPPGVVHRCSNCQRGYLRFLKTSTVRVG
jgi:hypothetical protein